MTSLITLTVFIVNLSEYIRGTNSIRGWVSFLGAQKCAGDDHSTEAFCLWELNPNFHTVVLVPKTFGGSGSQKASEKK